MQVIATAGHVDHGKSTLVRELTGMEPDRWAEERRRGMTIDLGFAWTTLPPDQTVAFVDVPGHARFVTNMLAGLGPVPAVLVVVAADEGWKEQTEEHVSAIDALGVRHGLLVVTRADLADPAPALEQARRRLAATSLGEPDAVAVSAATGAGLPELRDRLARLAALLPAGDPVPPPRIWVDRSFTIRGAGTVVTGTLPAGTVRAGDELDLAPSGRRVRVRGLQSLGRAADSVSAVARVAVNLRGVAADEVARGEALVAPGTWLATSTADARLGFEPPARAGALVAHVGSAAVGVRIRPLGGDRLARLGFDAALPLRVGDRLLVREPSAHRILGGATVIDPDPPPLVRRGAAAERAAQLAITTGSADVADELRRRHSASPAQLARIFGGWPAGIAAPAGAVPVAGLLVDAATLDRWRAGLVAAVDAHARARPLDAGLSVEEAARRIAAPRAVVEELAREGGLSYAAGRLLPAAGAALPAEAEAALAGLERRLAAEPFAAPEANDLQAGGLTPATLAAGVRLGRLIRVGEVYLAPSAPALAVERLAAIGRPFTMSEARAALGTTRRVAVPLLEHLDAIGVTRRLDSQQRVLVPAS